MTLKPKIMIACSNFEIVSILSKILGELGYEVTGVMASLQETVLRIQKSNPDLLIADPLLMSGHSKGYKLKDLESIIKIPVLMIEPPNTGLASGQTSGWISQPFRKDPIEVAVKTGLHKTEINKNVSQNAILSLAILENLEEGIIVTNEQGQISYANKRAASLLGVVPKWLQGKELDKTALFLTSQRQALEGVFAHALAKNISLEIKNGYISLPHGAEISIDLKVSLTDMNGKGRGLVVVIREIGAQRMAALKLAPPKAEPAWQKRPLNNCMYN